MKIKQVELFDVPFFAGSMEDALALIVQSVDSKGRQPLIVFTPNTEHVVMTGRNHDFLSALRTSDLNLPDSHGVVWGGKRLGIEGFPRVTIPGRICMMAVLEILEKRRGSVFFLGGKGDVAAAAAKKLKNTFPHLKIETDSGASSISLESKLENDRVLRHIDKTAPDALFVAYGAPYQEFWVMRNKEALRKAGVKVVMVVGGALDVLAGRLRVPPRQVQQLGVEWLWRLIQEPRRLGRQMALPQFYLRVQKEALKRRMSG